MTFEIEKKLDLVKPGSGSVDCRPIGFTYFWEISFSGSPIICDLTGEDSQLACKTYVCSTKYKKEIFQILMLTLSQSQSLVETSFLLIRTCPYLYIYIALFKMSYLWDFLLLLHLNHVITTILYYYKDLNKNSIIFI